MASMLRGIVRNSIEWQEDPYFGTEVPAKVQGLDISKFDLSRFYTKKQIGEYARALKEERQKYLASFSELNPKVAKAFAQKRN